MGRFFRGHRDVRGTERRQLSKPAAMRAHPSSCLRIEAGERAFGPELIGIFLDSGNLKWRAQCRL